MPYPDKTIETLLDTDVVSAATRSVIKQRIAPKETAPLFFEQELFRLLVTVCRQLLALPEGELAISVAWEIDKRLASGASNGWRYRQMPGDAELYTNGLKALDHTAVFLNQSAFTSLKPGQQADLLKQVQDGQPAGNAWDGLSPKIFFEELHCEATEIFYSYPYAQNEIGYAGMADAQGWKKTGFNEQEGAEPVEQPSGTGL